MLYSRIYLLIQCAGAAAVVNAAAPFAVFLGRAGAERAADSAAWGGTGATAARIAAFAAAAA